MHFDYAQRTFNKKNYQLKAKRSKIRIRTALEKRIKQQKKVHFDYAQRTFNKKY